MSTPSDPRTLVMHGLRLEGLRRSGGRRRGGRGRRRRTPSRVLDELVGEGLATYRDGRLSGFSLTKAGREQHAEPLAAELDARRRASRRRRRLPALPRRSTATCWPICTAWQLRDADGESRPQRPQPTPPTTPTVVERLATLHADVEPICADLAARARPLRWLRRPPLRRARAGPVAGDGDWFTKPMIASYHTVWFEMHEDLLSTLGIERGSEASPDGVRRASVGCSRPWSRRSTTTARSTSTAPSRSRGGSSTTAATAWCWPAPPVRPPR